MIDKTNARTSPWSLFMGLLLALMFTVPLQAQQSVVLTPSKDNTIYEDGGGVLSNGGGQYLFAGTSGLGLSRRAMLYFDVAGALAPEAVVDSVNLILTMSRTISETQKMTLHRLLADWGEGTAVGAGNEGGGAVAGPEDATWVYRLFDTVEWNSPGGDFLADTSAVVDVDSLGVYTIASTSGLVADVQAWLETPGENFGWLLRGNEADTGTAKRFNSRQNADTTTVPLLEVFYALPTAREQAAQPALLLDATSYPNPFQDHTTISFTLAHPAMTVLTIYDVLGRKVKTLLRHSLPAGRFSVDFDAGNLPAGAYFYQLDAGEERISKMVTRRR